MWCWFSLISFFSLVRFVEAHIHSHKQLMENGNAKQTSPTRLNTFTVVSALLGSATSILLGYGGSPNHSISFSLIFFH